MHPLRVGIFILLGTGLPVLGVPQQSAPIREVRSKESGSYELRANFSPEKRVKTLAEIRERLWLHWRQRQPTQLTVGEYETGRESHTTYAIEKDADGFWQLTINSKSVVADPWYPDEKYDQRSIYHVYSVERIRNGDSQLRLPVETESPSDSYHLVLLDRAGKIVQNL